MAKHVEENYNLEKGNTVVIKSNGKIVETKDKTDIKEDGLTFVGLTALSVEINIIFLVLYLSAQFATLYVPNTLFLIVSLGLSSIKGTCLCAAAWNTISGQ